MYNVSVSESDRSAAIKRMRGLLVTDRLAPTDAEVAAMLKERLTEKYKYVLTHSEYDKDKWKNDPYYRAIAIAEELEHKIDRTAEESAILELLVALIAKFEDEHYPINAGTPLQMLLHLMESNNVKQENLVGVIGSRGVVSEVVNGKRSISKAKAKALATFFSVDVGLFI